jgi:hypothetical protein
MNTETHLIRSLIDKWMLYTYDHTSEFVASRVAYDISSSSFDLDEHPHLNLNQAVSNDLLRRERLRQLVGRKGTSEDVNGTGRPPRVYRLP